VILACDPSLVNRTLPQPATTTTNSSIFGANKKSDFMMLTRTIDGNMLQKNEAQLQCLITEKFLECCRFDRYALTSIWEALLQQCWIDIVDTAALALERVKPDIFKKKSTTVDSDNEGEQGEGSGGGGVDFTLDYSKTLKAKMNLEPPNHTIISSIQAANMLFSTAQHELFDAFMGCVYTKEDLIENDLTRQFLINLGHETFNTSARAFVSSSSSSGVSISASGTTGGFGSRQGKEWDVNCMAGIDILSYATDMKISFWLHDLTPLIDLIQRHTLRKFKLTKSSMEVRIVYLLCISMGHLT
jgi:hypothetical protein